MSNPLQTRTLNVADCPLIDTVYGSSDCVFEVQVALYERTLNHTDEFSNDEVQFRGEKEKR